MSLMIRLFRAWLKLRRRHVAEGPLSSNMGGASRVRNSENTLTDISTKA